MAKVYSDEEKQALLDQHKVSGKSRTEFARENGIPEGKCSIKYTLNLDF